MAKRTLAAILMCAVMVLVAAVPLALADIHEVVKGPQGPRASAITWEFAPPGLGVWSAKITNNGLRSLVIDVYDNTTGVPDGQNLHQRIRFAAYNAYPAGIVTSETVVMSASHKYDIWATPNGPKGSTCTIEDLFRLAVPPVALFDATTVGMTVTVDASASNDPEGQAITYSWDFGDGAVGSDKIMTHTYLTPGEKTIVLTVTDTDGLTDTESKLVYPAQVDVAPVASFTPTMNWMVVSVDASASTDANNNIATLTWDWGDGSAPETFDWATTKTATHTYLTEGEKTITLTATDSTLLSGTATAKVTAVMPKPPVAGFTVDLTAFDTVSVDASTLSYDQNTPALPLTYAWDFGDGMTAGDLASTTHTYAKAGSYTIKLTVTNTIPLSAQATQPITLVDVGPTASFLISVSGLTVSVDAAASDDDWGIKSYTWNWNDGSPTETYLYPTMTASHTYAVPPASVAPSSSTGRQEPPPYTIMGYCYDGDTTTKLAGASVVVTDVTKGKSSPVLTSSLSGVYTTNLYSWCPTYAAGDVITAHATLGDKVGDATGVVSGSALALNIRLYGAGPQPFEVTITLTVTDTADQTATVSQKVMLTPP